MINMKIWQVRNEVISNKKSHKNPIINDFFQVIGMQQFILWNK